MLTTDVALKIKLKKTGKGGTIKQYLIEMRKRHKGPHTL